MFWYNTFIGRYDRFLKRMEFKYDIDSKRMKFTYNNLLIDYNFILGFICR